MSQYLGGLDVVGAASMEQSTRQRGTVEAGVGGGVDHFDVFY
mgnify:FL=1